MGDWFLGAAAYVTRDFVRFVMGVAVRAITANAPVGHTTTRTNWTNETNQTKLSVGTWLPVFS